MRIKPEPGVVRYLGALAAVAVATAGQALWHRPATDPFPYEALLVALVLVAWLGGLYPALLAAVAGALASDYFLLRPRHSFAVHGRDQIAGAVFYLAIAIGILFLAGAIKAARRRTQLAVDDLRDQIAVIDQAYDAVLVWDWNGPITFWSQGAERLYGFSRAEAFGRGSHELLGTRLAGGFESVLETLEQSGVWEGELERQAADGRELVVASRMVLVRESGPGRVLEASRDLTERRLSQVALREAHDLLEARVRERTEKLTHANEALQVSEAQVRLLVESVSDHAIFMLAADGMIQTWNKGAERIFGYTADESIGRDYAVLFAAEDRGSGQPLAELEQAVNEGHADIAGWRVRKSGERFWVTGTTAVVRDQHGATKGFATIARDSTAARRDDEQTRADLSRIDEASEPAAALTRRQILEPVDLNIVVEEAVRHLAPELGANVGLVARLDASPASVLVDRSQFELVLSNLAENARDAMGADGTLTIRTSSVELDEAEALVRIDATPGQFVLLQVTDTGSGMDAETRARIFEPFFTTKPDGRGLGLATVYGIVTQIGGHIRVYSAPGLGSTFELYFPYERGPEGFSAPL